MLAALLKVTRPYPHEPVFTGLNVTPNTTPAVWSIAIHWGTPSTLKATVPSVLKLIWQLVTVPLPMVPRIATNWVLSVMLDDVTEPDGDVPQAETDYDNFIAQ